ncbi:50S ribosomal protein L25/general stress protein Ctc [Desulfofalx alkaliphila]|uniref:50S ribosomal protein L25/general stress protein Ctc n=1 Tax=Desulfofalx alkaliphila TaxID=105483 RepID=UPI00054EE3E3|nr:50S ribosomal protein L25/general stress protein Ctc [Desulfofalx alkaliphila]
MAAVLQATAREGMKKSRLTQLRQQGNVPGVVYGKSFGNQPVFVDEKAFIKTLRSEGKTGVISLDIEGKKTNVMIYDTQFDLVKNQFVHVDFYAVDMNVEMDANVPVRLIGEAEGVKMGGLLQQMLYELSVRALPVDIPDAIEVDVSELAINGSIMVKDLTEGANYKFNNEPDEVIVSVLAPVQEQGAETEEETEAGDAAVSDGEGAE